MVIRQFGWVAEIFVHSNLSSAQTLPKVTGKIVITLLWMTCPSRLLPSKRYSNLRILYLIWNNRVARFDLQKHRNKTNMTSDMYDVIMEPCGYPHIFSKFFANFYLEDKVY